SASNDNFRYMKKVSRLNREDLTPDELFDSQNALEILTKITEGYEPEPLSLHELEEEAAARGMSATDLLNRKGIEPGEISRRLIMHDIAADKLDEKLTNLYSKIREGNATAKDREDYADTLIKFQQLATRIF